MSQQQRIDRTCNIQSSCFIRALINTIDKLSDLNTNFIRAIQTERPVNDSCYVR